MHRCIKCDGPTKGYKCDICGEESVSHDPNHEHGGDHHMPRCQECKEAEVDCRCRKG